MTTIPERLVGKWKRFPRTLSLFVSRQSVDLYASKKAHPKILDVSKVEVMQAKSSSLRGETPTIRSLLAAVPQRLQRNVRRSVAFATVYASGVRRSTRPHRRTRARRPFGVPLARAPICTGSDMLFQLSFNCQPSAMPIRDNPDPNRVTDWPVHSYPDKCPTGLTRGPTRTAGPGVRSLAGLCPTLGDQLAIQWSFQMGFGHEVWEVTCRDAAKIDRNRRATLTRLRRGAGAC
jgi:hypothetical protein